MIVRQAHVEGLAALVCHALQPAVVLGAFGATECLVIYQCPTASSACNMGTIMDAPAMLGACPRILLSTGGEGNCFLSSLPAASHCRMPFTTLQESRCPRPWLLSGTSMLPC